MSCVQVKRIARAIYSNPPLHGALLVNTVLQDPALKSQWFEVRRGIARLAQAGLACACALAMTCA